MKKRHLNIVLIGDFKCGKTSIIQRFHNDIFNESPSHTVNDNEENEILIEEYEISDKIKCDVSITDTAGEEKYRSITTSYFRNKHAFFVVFDTTDKITFENLNLWTKELREKNNMGRRQVILLGNKIDLEEERQISKEEAQNYANQNSMKYIEVSAKTDINIDLAFKELIKLSWDEFFDENITQTPKNSNDDPNKGNVDITSPNSGNDNKGLCSGCKN
eukprot:TRINITY_DN561_c0_g4_i2.p1 TRINITY_DN561_c0_g4~~TRINITY_DN561_c0_g4_i2.p1  ORF type:complete len:218 (+),score=41.16 TRINITY_DN561_c0_g4_i2:85-738(+)